MREGMRGGGREGEREEWMERWMDGGKEEGIEGVREGGREGEREGRRERAREGEKVKCIYEDCIRVHLIIPGSKKRKNNFFLPIHVYLFLSLTRASVKD